MDDQWASIVLSTLFVVFLSLLTVALVRYAEEERRIAQSKREYEGHVCNRLFHRNLISALDKKTINRGWFFALNKYKKQAQKKESMIMKDYWRTFYTIPDDRIDFPRLTARMKGMVKDLKENGDRDLVVYFMHILRDCVDDDAYFDAPRRKRVWDAVFLEEKALLEEKSKQSNEEKKMSQHG